MLTNLSDITHILNYAITSLGVFGGVYAFFRYGSYKSTVNLQNDNIRALKEQNLLQGQSQEELIKSNGALEVKVRSLSEKVDTLSTIPLAKIERHMKDTNDILKSLVGVKNEKV